MSVASYSILSSNVVLGSTDAPAYSFITAQNGVLQLECLDPGVLQPTLQVDGVVACDTVQTTLSSSRVIASSADGTLVETSVGIDTFEEYDQRLEILEGETSNIGIWETDVWQYSADDGAERVYFANAGPTIMRTGDGTFTIQNTEGSNVLHITPDGNVVVSHIVGDGRFLSNVASSNASLLDQGTVLTTLLPSNIIIQDDFYGNAVYANVAGEQLYGNVEADFIIEGGNLHADLIVVGGNLSLDVPLQLPDGTEEVPSLCFLRDTSTGLFRPGPGTLSVVCRGQTRLQVGEDGVVTADAFRGAISATNLASGVVDRQRLPQASTKATGIVQLEDRVVSRSVETAPTSNAMYEAYSQINALNQQMNVVLATTNLDANVGLTASDLTVTSVTANTLTVLDPTGMRSDVLTGLTVSGDTFLKTGILYGDGRGLTGLSGGDCIDLERRLRSYNTSALRLYVSTTAAMGTRVGPQTRPCAPFERPPN